MPKKESLLGQILSQQLSEAKRKNSRYSLRALARSLDVSPASLSRILSGKSNLSQKITQKIIRNLKIDSRQREELLAAEHDPYVESFNSHDLQALVDDWYMTPIACLAETKIFKEDPKWIAGRLGITSAQAKNALFKLQQLGVLTRNKDGRLVTADVAISTTNIKKSGRADKHFLDKNKLVQRNLLIDDLHLRSISDVGSIVMATNPNKIEEVKKRTKTFRRSLAKYLDAGEKTEVYLIFTQVIPLSKIKS